MPLGVIPVREIGRAPAMGAPSNIRTIAGSLITRSSASFREQANTAHTETSFRAGIKLAKRSNKAVRVKSGGLLAVSITAVMA